MEGRSERIRDDLAKADTARREAEEVLAHVPAAGGRLQGRGHPHHRGRPGHRRGAQGRPGRAGPRPRSPRCASGPQADIEASKAQAIADLTGEVASLSIGAAEVVVQRNLDRDTQVQLIENYINQVGSTN